MDACRMTRNLACWKHVCVWSGIWRIITIKKMQLNIVFMHLLLMCTELTLAEEPNEERTHFPTQRDMIQGVDIHNKVFSNMVLKPLLRQLEKSPVVLEEIREKQLRLKVNHESESESYIDPESFGLSFLSGMRIKLTHKARSEFVIDPLMQENDLLGIDELELRKRNSMTRSGLHTISGQGISGLYKYNNPLVVQNLEKDRTVQKTDDPSVVFIRNSSPLKDASRDENYQAMIAFDQNAARLVNNQIKCHEEYGLMRCNADKPILQIKETDFIRNTQPMYILRIQPPATPSMFLQQINRLSGRPFVLPFGFPYLHTVGMKYRHQFIT